MTNSQSAVEGIGKEEDIYKRRFGLSQEQARQKTWAVLCQRFFQPRIDENSTVLDLGAGDGHFVTNIKAKRKIAADLSPHVNELQAHGIEVYQVPATALPTQLHQAVDIVFMSNFLEHLPSKRTVVEVLEQCRLVLKTGGKLMILQPNIRYVGAAYWDYIDHHIALTEHSLVEALEICGFTVVDLVPRFLPYTAKSRFGLLAGQSNSTWLIEFYLKFPLFWRIFGQQTFVMAIKES